MKIAVSCVMFMLLGVLLAVADITVDMWQFHAITLWAIALVGIWRQQPCANGKGAQVNTN